MGITEQTATYLRPQSLTTSILLACATYAIAVIIPQSTIHGSHTIHTVMLTYMHDSDMMIVIIMTTMLLLTVGLVSGNGGGVCGIVVDGGRIGAMGRSADGKDDLVHTTEYIHSPTPTQS